MVFNLKVYINVAVCLVLILLYQNCGGDFTSDQESLKAVLGDQPQGDQVLNDQTPNSEPKNTEILNENEIIVTKVNPTQINLKWSVGKLSSATVEYGLNESNLDKRVVDESFSKELHTLTLKDLKPDSEYFYKVSSETIGGEKFKSNLYTFHTAETVEVLTEFLIEEDNISITETFESANFEWDVGVNSKAYIEYGLTDKLGTVTYRETSFDYSSHKQQIKNLKEETTYYYQIICESEAGAIYKSEINTFKTLKKTVENNLFQANYIEFSQFTQKDKVDASKRGPLRVREGNWSGIKGSTSPGQGVQSWQRVTITANKYFGASSKLLLDPSIKEAWASYQVQLGSNWTPTDGVKLPGFTGHHNGGPTGVAGGNGGGWGGLCKSWSARTILSPPGNKYHGLHRIYLYHKDNKNFAGGAKASDHPCINKNNKVPATTGLRAYGNMVSGSETIKDNKWHTITHHVKLNDIGKSNGLVELFIDGKPAGRQANINLTDNPKYHNIAFWFQIYHGGSADKSGTEHDIFFHGFNWNAGPVNKTKIKFD